MSLADPTPPDPNNPDSNDATDALVYHGSGRLARQVFSRSVQFYADGWELTPEGTVIGASLESESGTAAHGNNVGNSSEIALGNFPTVTDKTGREYNYVYDADNYPIKKTYPDDTVEYTTYNAFKQVTRFQDRLKRVTRFTYDTRGNLQSREVGIRNAGDDGKPADDGNVLGEYAFFVNAYYPTGHASEHLLRYSYDAKFNRTEYKYFPNHLLKEIWEPDDTGSGFHRSKSFTYDAALRLATSTDAMGRKTTFEYDARDRNVKTIYNDGSTEENLYGTGDDANLVIARKDRNGNVSTCQYDAQGRKIQNVTGHDNVGITGTILVDYAAPAIPDSAAEQTCTYLDGTNLRASCTTNGERTDYIYDYRHRLVSTTVYPRAGKSLTTTSQYLDNLLFSRTDAYGRKTYHSYRTSDNALIRTVQATHDNPASAPVDYMGVMNLIRGAHASHQTAINPVINGDYLIRDVVRDAAGQTVANIDPRGIVDAMVYDSRGRTVMSIESATTLPPFNEDSFDPSTSQLNPLAARTQTIYDADSNVVEVRHPRWFDSSDTLGFEQCNTKSIYTRRNLVKEVTRAASTLEHKEGSDTDVRVSMSYEYYNDGRQRSVTDHRGNVSKQLWHACCGRSQGSIDQVGHGRISNTDKYGNVTHTAFVKDLQDDVEIVNGLDVVASAHDPFRLRTLSETTIRYDERHRMVARTVWLDPLGFVEQDNVPIAGGGQPDDPTVDPDDPVGLTTRMFYDENLNDAIGLSGGIRVDNIGGSGYFTLDISDLIAEMNSDGISIGPESDFHATATVNPENEISVSISDGIGRSVVQGIIAQDGTPITWSSVLHDNEEVVPGFGRTLETVNIDALDHETKSRSDAGGRTLEFEDALTNVSRAFYDANGNALVSRDANFVGQSCVYDVRDRRTSCTDTRGDTTSVAYDQNSNVIETKDAKELAGVGDHDGVTTYKYDALDRRFEVTDRLGGVTTTHFDKNSNVRLILDGDNALTDAKRATVYTYDDRNLKMTSATPDHDPAGSDTAGNADYGEKQYDYDALSRTILMTDQNGDTQTHGYDMASRLLRKDYRTAANSPTGNIEDSDVFTYDLASRRKTATNGRYVNICAVSYDDAGRPVGESLTTNGATFTTLLKYDAANRLEKQTYPDGSVVDRRYTDRNQLEQVDWNGLLVHSRGYDDGARLKTTSHDNVVSTFNYRDTFGSQDNQLKEILTTGGATGVGDYRYAYDENKNKLSETISGPLEDYGYGAGASLEYDSDDRLTKWGRDDGNLDRIWELSLVGRWNSVTDNASPLTTLTHSPAHEINNFGGAQLSHDSKGNRTLDQLGRTLVWDFDNRLRSATVPAGSPKGEVGTHSYAYDALGRRVSKTTGGELTIFACAGSQVLCEYRLAAGGTPNPDSPDQRYVYGSYVDEVLLKEGTDSNGINSAILYYHRNQQYSIVALTNAAGLALERYAYTAYGELTVFNGAGAVLTDGTAYANPYTFTARRLDKETGLMYFRARYYDASLGEFISRDPLGYVDGMSQYRAYFVPGGVDPSGLKTCSAWINTTLELKFTIWGKTTANDPWVTNVSGSTMTDAIVKTADKQITKKIKKEAWKAVEEQLNDALKEAVKNIKRRKPSSGLMGNANLGNLEITDWKLEPVYKVDYRVVCCDFKKRSSSAHTGETEKVGSALVAKQFKKRGGLWLNNADNRQEVIDSIKNGMKGIQQTMNLKKMRTEAWSAAKAHIGANVGCCKNPRLLDQGGLGKPPVSWGG